METENVKLDMIYMYHDFVLKVNDKDRENLVIEIKDSDTEGRVIPFIYEDLFDGTVLKLNV